MQATVNKHGDPTSTRATCVGPLVIATAAVTKSGEREEVITTKQDRQESRIETFLFGLVWGWGKITCSDTLGIILCWISNLGLPHVQDVLQASESSPWPLD